MSIALRTSTGSSYILCSPPGFGFIAAAKTDCIVILARNHRNEYVRLIWPLPAQPNMSIDWRKFIAEPVPAVEGMGEASLDYDVETLRRFLRHRLPVSNIEPLFQLLTAA